MIHHEQPIFDPHWEGDELGTDDTHRYLRLWHGYNIRLIAIAHGPEGRWSYDYAWCYPRDPQAVQASVAAWNSTTQDEPTGWHKRPTATSRRAPQRNRDPRYNRDRCVHGPYLDEGCRTINCPEEHAYRVSHSASPGYATPVPPFADLLSSTRQRTGNGGAPYSARHDAPPKDAT